MHVPCCFVCGAAASTLCSRYARRCWASGHVILQRGGFARVVAGMGRVLTPRPPLLCTQNSKGSKRAPKRFGSLSGGGTTGGGGGGGGGGPPSWRRGPSMRGRNVRGVADYRTLCHTPLPATSTPLTSHTRVSQRFAPRPAPGRGRMRKLGCARGLWTRAAAAAHFDSFGTITYAAIPDSTCTLQCVRVYFTPRGAI